MSQSAPLEETARTDAKPADAPPVVVKKYANRRLYNTESSSYITLDSLAEMVRIGRDFVVYDAKTGEDITRSVLTQIIVEEESKGRAMLPTGFLRQLIGYYGNSMQAVVPKYLEQAMGAFAVQQDQMRRAVEHTMGPFIPPSLQEVSRQNMAMMERAMSLFSPFLPQEPEAISGTPAQMQEEIAALRREVDMLRQQLVEARAAGRKE
jgi:polyhydroxyalkanoate synthesis repressor PhaR